MKKIGLTLSILISLTACLPAQTQTIQERLGYSKEAKLVIIHADDLGVSHSENEASIFAMEKGSVSSASIMVPTPWFTEIANYARSHAKADLGLHLTLTSEWDNYKWRSLADNVPGLNNKQGFLFADVDSVYKSASLPEIETELRKQIDKAYQFGIDVTHFDSHMGTLFGNPDYLKIYIRLGREYHVPVMIPAQVKPILGTFLTDEDVVVDDILTASPADFKKGMEDFYKGVINNMKPGLNVIIIHTAYDNEEMQSVTINHPDWGSKWRQSDFDFFTSPACKKLLQDPNIHLVTWREIRDKLIRR